MAAAVVSQGSALELAGQLVVTISIATPGVITWNAHGLAANTPVSFATTGALPTGLVAGTRYFVKNPLTNSFEVSATAGGASINTTGGQSGVHTATSFHNIVGIQESLQLSISNTLQEITDLADTFKKFIKTIAGGQLSLTVNWLANDPGHILLLAAAISGAERLWYITLKDEADPAQIYSFNALIESYQRSATVAGVQKLQVSLTLSSLPS